VRTVLIPHCHNSSKIESKIVEKGKIDTSSAQICDDRSLSWHGTDKKLVLYS
jgi:hypothetical protein